MEIEAPKDEMSEGAAGTVQKVGTQLEKTLTKLSTLEKAKQSMQGELELEVLKLKNTMPKDMFDEVQGRVAMLTETKSDPMAAIKSLWNSDKSLAKEANTTLQKVADDKNPLESWDNVMT